MVRHDVVLVHGKGKPNLMEVTLLETKEGEDFPGPPPKAMITMAFGNTLNTPHTRNMEWKRLKEASKTNPPLFTEGSQDVLLSFQMHLVASCSGGTIFFQQKYKQHHTRGTHFRRSLLHYGIQHCTDGHSTKHTTGRTAGYLNLKP